MVQIIAILLIAAAIALSGPLPKLPQIGRTQRIDVREWLVLSGDAAPVAPARPVPPPRSFDWASVRHPAHYDLAPGAAIPDFWLARDEQIRLPEPARDLVIGGFADEEAFPAAWRLFPDTRSDFLFA